MTMNNQVSYKEFNTMYNELYKRMNDYYGDGTFMGFKMRMDSFIFNFKSEYLKNLSFLNKDNKTAYIGHLKNELSKLEEIFHPGDKRYIGFLAKFDINEHDLFNHEKIGNELYRILTDELFGLKQFYKRNIAPSLTYDEVVDILRIFYRQFCYHFISETITFVNSNGVMVENSNPSKPDISGVKSNVNSFGFAKDKIEKLKTIYHRLILDSGDFIDKEHTTVDEFVNILIAKNYNDVPGVIHFGCETTQAAYIITAMQKLSKGFTYERISVSKKFHSEKGKIITSSNLSKSKSTTPQPKQFDVIDKFFASLVLHQ